MSTGPELPSRKHPRLRDYDYSRNGVYFLTICTRNRAPILSEIVGRGIPDAPLVRLTEIGRCVQDAMAYLAEQDPQIQIEASVIMPNHIHILLGICGAEGGASGMPRPTGMRVPKFVSSLKRYTNRVCGRPLWQTSYHDHIIRDDNDFLNHWSYLNNNPARWAEDEYYVCTTKGTGTTWAFLKRSRRG